MGRRFTTLSSNAGFFFNVQLFPHSDVQPYETEWRGHSYSKNDVAVPQTIFLPLLPNNSKVKQLRNDVDSRVMLPTFVFRWLFRQGKLTSGLIRSANGT